MSRVNAISAVTATGAAAGTNLTDAVQAQLRLVGRWPMAGSAAHSGQPGRTREQPRSRPAAGTTRDRRPGTGASSKLDRLGSLLGMSADELAGQIADGTDLMDLLRRRGVSVERLRTALDNGDLVDVSA